MENLKQQPEATRDESMFKMENISEKKKILPLDLGPAVSVGVIQSKIV